MTEPLTPDELEAIRDNEVEPCWGCGCVPRLEHDGIMHRYHRAGCEVMRRVRDMTGGDDES